MKGNTIYFRTFLVLYDFMKIDLDNKQNANIHRPSLGQFG